MLAAVGGRNEVPGEQFWVQLHVRARSAIRERVESGATTGFSGATGACWRRRSLRTSAATFLAERGRPASIDELVEFHDQRMRKRRARPSQAGALLSPAELVEKRIISPTQTTCRRPAVSRKRVCSRATSWLMRSTRSWPGVQLCRGAPDRLPVCTPPRCSPINRPRPAASGPGSGGPRRPCAHRQRDRPPGSGRARFQRICGWLTPVHSSLAYQAARHVFPVQPYAEEASPLAALQGYPQAALDVSYCGGPPIPLRRRTPERFGLAAYVVCLRGPGVRHCAPCVPCNSARRFSWRRNRLELARKG